MQVLIKSNKKLESGKLIPYILLGGMVTVMNAEGKPVQVPAGALQAANVQNSIGKLQLIVSKYLKKIRNQF